MLILGFFTCPCCGNKHDTVQFYQSRRGAAEWLGECPAMRCQIKLLIVAVKPEKPGPSETK